MIDLIFARFEELKVFGSGNHPLAIEKRYYDSSGNLEYVALATQGAATSDAKWRIAKYVSNANGSIETIKWSKPNQIADNYADLDYT